MRDKRMVQHIGQFDSRGMLGVLLVALRNLFGSVSSGLCQEEFEELQHIAQEKEVKSDGT